MKLALLVFAGALLPGLGAEPPPAGWRLFDDPRLSALIAEALDANPDVRIAAARLALDEAEFALARSDRFPSLGAGMGAERRAYSREERRDDPGIASPASRFTLGAAAAYEVDLWGRVRHSVAAGRADMLASALDLDAARVSLAAEMATTWFLLRGELAEEDILLRWRDAAQQQLALVQHRVAAGSAGSDAIAVQRSILAQLDAERVERVRLQALYRNRLAALCGRTSSFDPPSFSTSTWPELGAPAGLTSEAIFRRPDVLAANARVSAGQARVGQARAETLPTLNLTANGVFSSQALRDLLDRGSLSGWVAAQFNLPLLDGGRRKARLRAAEAELLKATGEYTAATVRAFQETADALSAVESARARVVAARTDFEARDRRLLLVVARFAAGTADRVEVLELQISRLVAEREELRARLDQTLAGISLGRALAAGFGLSVNSALSADHEIHRERIPSAAASRTALRLRSRAPRLAPAGAAR